MELDLQKKRLWYYTRYDDVTIPNILGYDPTRKHVLISY